MRSLWTGSLSFGLVNIPVKLYNGTQSVSLDLDMLHKKDLSPIRYARVCKEEGDEVPYDEIVKGYEFEKGQYVVVSDKDFEKADVEKSKSIEIIAFVDADEIDPSYFDKPYLIEPDKGADKPYALLAKALSDTGRAGIAQFVMRNREHLCMVRPDGPYLILNQMRFIAELQPSSQINVPNDISINEKELQLAKNLIDQLTETFHPEKYHDTYHEKLKALIEAKIEGKEPAKTGKTPKSSNVKDLMSLLEASLNQSKSGKAKPNTEPRQKPANKPAASKRKHA